MSSLNYWLYPEKSAFQKNDFRSIYFRGTWQKHFINVYVDERFKNGENSALKQFANYKDEHLPKYLYKFCPPSQCSLTNLENARLWLAPPETFNDPFDGYIGIDQDSFCKRMIARELKSRGVVTKESTKNSISEKEYIQIRYAYTGLRNSPNREQQRLSRILYELKNSKNPVLSSLLLQLQVDAEKTCKEKITRLRNSAFRVSCFSAFNDEEELGYNTTMWSHYAANHAGFCVKYKLDPNQYPEMDELKCGLYPVKYSGGWSRSRPWKSLRLL